MMSLTKRESVALKDAYSQRKGEKTELTKNELHENE